MPAITIREMLVDEMAEQGETWFDFICHDVAADLYNSDPHIVSNSRRHDDPLTFHAWTRRRVYYLNPTESGSWVVNSVPRNPPDPTATN